MANDTTPPAGAIQRFCTICAAPQPGEHNPSRHGFDSLIDYGPNPYCGQCGLRKHEGSCETELEKLTKERDLYQGYFRGAQEDLRRWLSPEWEEAERELAGDGSWNTHVHVAIKAIRSQARQARGHESQDCPCESASAHYWHERMEKAMEEGRKLTAQFKAAEAERDRLREALKHAHKLLEVAHGLIDPELEPRAIARIEAVLRPCDDADHCPTLAQKDGTR